MVQIVQGDEGFGSKFSKAFTPTLLDAFEKSANRVRENRERQEQGMAEQQLLEQETKGLKEAGYNVPSSVRNPKLREALLSNQQKQQAGTGDIEKDEARKETLSRYFGPNVAELYGVLTEGGKTQLSNIAVESLARQQPFEETLKRKLLSNPEDAQEIVRDLEQYDAQETVAGPKAAQSRLPENKRPGQTVGLLPKEIAKEESEERKFKREHETKRSDKVLEEAYDLSKNIPLQQANIDLIKGAINEVGGIDQDFLAEVFHFEPLRTAKGSQLKSAGKDLFLKTIQGAGTRPNQWIEQQIGSALTQIGKSPEANETISEIAQFQLDLNKKKVDIIGELEDRYENEFGYVPGKIGKEAQQLLLPYAQERQDQLAYDLRRIYEKEQGVEKLSEKIKVPSGTPLTLEMARALLKKTNGDKEAAEKLAKKIGYSIPSAETYSRGAR